jgi:hypothetical protein
LEGIADRSFDLVVSIFGAMFAPKPLDVAKEKVSVAASEAMEASRNPQILATISTSRRYANPWVVALTGNRL